MAFIRGGRDFLQCSKSASCNFGQRKWPTAPPDVGGNPINVTYQSKENVIYLSYLLTEFKNATEITKWRCIGGPWGSIWTPFRCPRLRDTDLEHCS